MAGMFDLLIVVFDGRIARFFKGDASAGLKPVSEVHALDRLKSRPYLLRATAGTQL